MRSTLLGVLGACILGAAALAPHAASAAHADPVMCCQIPVPYQRVLDYVQRREGHTPAIHPRVLHATKRHLSRNTTTHRGHTAHPATAAVSAPKAQMLGLINAERAQAGVGPLAFDPTLGVIAQARSQDMIARHYFSHQIPGAPGVHMVFDLLDRANVQYQMAGENIALNNYITVYSMTQTVQQTNNDLMNSPEHRANLLEPKYTRLGLGMAFEPGTGKLILTEVFVQP